MTDQGSRPDALACLRTEKRGREMRRGGAAFGVVRERNATMRAELRTRQARVDDPGAPAASPRLPTDRPAMLATWADR